MNGVPTGVPPASGEGGICAFVLTFMPDRVRFTVLAMIVPAVLGAR
ncbi:hypothetical protein [Streptomyces sp. NPDC004579]